MMDGSDVERHDAKAKSGTGKGYNPNRARDGKFGKGSRKAKSAPKFNAAPHQKKIARLKAAEAKHRRASIALKAKMAATKANARAKAKTPKQRAAAKAHFEKLKAKRDGLKAKADQAKTKRIEATKAMQGARKEHGGKRKVAREKAKAERAAKREASGKGKPTAEDVTRQTKEAGEATEYRNASLRHEVPTRTAAAHEMTDADHAKSQNIYEQKLTGDEKWASYIYASTDAVWHVNNRLRGKPSKDEGVWKGRIPEVTSRLDSALRKAPPLDRPVTVYRGVRKGTPFDRLKPGDSYSDKAYHSTSTRPDLAHQFTNGAAFKADGVLLRITLPKGAKAGAIPSPFSATEREMLLPRGSKFRVDRVVGSTGPGRPKEVFVTLVHDGKD